MKDKKSQSNQNTESQKPNCYVLDMFPYPSGDGLHVGHPKGYIATDIYSRYKKMNGYNVVHPMGWDAFGLPAEQYAIKNKVHPRLAVEKNVANFKNQLEKINFDYDWDRELSTTDPKFYKWTQWIFKQLYKKGLAYESFEPINWCPSCKTGLANEDLEGNACERCGSVVEQKPLRQWSLRITDYADRLIDDLDSLILWPEHVKTAQRNWIGRSEGAEIEFEIIGTDLSPALSTREGEEPAYHTANIKTYESLKQKAIEMRKSPTATEEKMWGMLRVEFKEFNFRRQHIIDNFIVDFVSLKHQLVIEIDGKIHDSQRERDQERTEILNNLNFKVIRFTNEEVINNIEKVILDIKKELDQVDVASPLPCGEGWGGALSLKIFTTRPDTIFGCTFMAINFNIAKEWIQSGWQASDEVKNFINKLEEEDKNRSIDFDLSKLEKEGIDTGILAINPANQKEMPIYIANYVLSDYGTGAIMAVPAHDERDYEFAKKYDIEIVDVVGPVFEDKTETSKWREGKSVRKRNVVMGIIRDKSNSKYCVLDWKLNNWRTFVSGMIEENETKEEALLREIKEETGLHNVKIIKSLGFNFSKYFIPHKDFNNETVNFIYYCEVENNEHTALDEEENKKHVVKWLEKKDLLKFFEDSKQYQDISYLKYGLEKLDNNIFYGEGKLFNSGIFDGMSSEEAKCKIVDFVGGKMVKKYKLKEWVFARQRYWGEPFPIVFEVDETNLSPTLSSGEGAPPLVGEVGRGLVSRRSYVVADSELPVLLPEVESYEPTGTGESPLADIKSFTDVYGYINSEGEFESSSPSLWEGGQRPEGVRLFRRETNTMPQWAGSSWYWLRFLDPHNDKMMIDPKIEKAWPQVDVYVGGDHATRHLIYARFWHKFLYDIGVVSHIEPFKRLEFLGFVLAEDGRKMSKSKGNTINPNDIIARYGSDAFRLYEMFMAPFEATAVWSTASIRGVKKFLDRVEKLGEKISMPIIMGNILPDAKEVSGSTVIAYDKKKNLFLKLNNLNSNETWLPSGGINAGESYGECAIRELKEEAGISKIDEIINLGPPIISYYFNPNKNSNRKSLGYNYLAFVDSEQEINFAHEEHEKFSVEWVTYDGLYSDMKSTAVDVDHWLKALEWAKEYLENKNSKVEIAINQTIKKVGEDIEGFKFNTAVSQMMICLNEFEEKGASLEDYKKFLTILAPFAPSLFEKLEQELDLEKEWPKYDENKLASSTVNIALQINGKLRGTFEAGLNSDDEQVIELAKSIESYKKYVVNANSESVEPKKIIVVKNKIVNVVL